MGEGSIQCKEGENGPKRQVSDLAYKLGGIPCAYDGVLALAARLDGWNPPYMAAKTLDVQLPERS